VVRTSVRVLGPQLCSHSGGVAANDTHANGTSNSAKWQSALTQINFQYMHC